MMTYEQTPLISYITDFCLILLLYHLKDALMSMHTRCRQKQVMYICAKFLTSLYRQNTCTYQNKFITALLVPINCIEEQTGKFGLIP